MKKYLVFGENNPMFSPQNWKEEELSFSEKFILRLLGFCVLIALFYLVGGEDFILNFVK